MLRHVRATTAHPPPQGTLFSHVENMGKCGVAPNVWVYLRFKGHPYERNIGHISMMAFLRRFQKYTSCILSPKSSDHLQARNLLRCSLKIYP